MRAGDKRGEIFSIYPAIQQLTYRLSSKQRSETMKLLREAIMKYITNGTSLQTIVLSILTLPYSVWQVSPTEKQGSLRRTILSPQISKKLHQLTCRQCTCTTDLRHLKIIFYMPIARIHVQCCHLRCVQKGGCLKIAKT